MKGKFVRETTLGHWKASPSTIEKLFAAGYNEANLVDIVIGDKIISNYLHNLTGIPVDFPAAPKL